MQIKKLIIILVLISSTINAQEGTRAFRKEPLVRVYGIYPIQFGDHAYAKGYRESPGFGFALSFFNYKGFRFAAGLDALQYKVTDQALIGTYIKSYYRSIYFSPSYEINAGGQFSILPDIGVGALLINEKRFGNRSGAEFRIGVFTDYDFDKNISLFAGLHYIYSKIGIDTNARYQNFYGQATQLQICLGLKIH